MKRIVLIFSLILLSTTLCGCERPRPFNYERSYFDGVDSVEIINLLNDDPIEYEVLKTIQGENLSVFLDELSEITFHQVYSRPYRPSGLTLKVNYEDRYLLINEKVLGQHKHNNEFIPGSIIYTGRSDETLEFINKWLDQTSE